MKMIDKCILIVILIMIVTFVFIKTFSNRSEIILLDYASFKMTNMLSNQINESINEVLYENTYDNIIKDYKDSNGNIVNLDFDNLIVNRLITNNLLQKNIINTNDKIYYIPLGVIYNVPVLNNLGPKIPFKIEIIKSINNSAKINVKEYGINSSIVELLLNINMQIEVIMPFKSKRVAINKNIVLDSKIVQGKVPDYYGGLISGSLN